jgi:hypothetical protein
MTPGGLSSGRPGRAYPRDKLLEVEKIELATTLQRNPFVRASLFLFPYITM